MDLHNLMEDVILQYLEEVLNLKKDNICKCEQCKLDMACYALNKVKPMYVVSSRGVVHSQNMKRLNYQNDIDVYSIVTEAVDVVSKTRRHDDYFPKNDTSVTQGCEYENLKGNFFFNFPQIIGRVLDSDTLSPMSDVKISLNAETSDESVKMFNERWKNPVNLVNQMQGAFSFWPVPSISDKEGIQKDFQFNLKISKEGYEPIRKFFEIRVISSKILNRFIINDNIFYIEDIYLYPEGLGEDEEFTN